MGLKMRQKKCKGCGEKFLPSKPLQSACSIQCAIQVGTKTNEKKQRQVDRARREKLKTRSDHMKEAQIAFNAYIRARDKGKPCICCGKPLELDAVGGGHDCGHYRSVGSAPHLRFDPRNAHGQRKQCNRWGSGRAVDYRIGLIARIGLEAVESLEADQTPRKYTIEELKAIRETYRKMRRDIERD